MSLWIQALRQGFRLALRAKRLWLLPVLLDLGALFPLLLVAGVPPGGALEFSLPVAFPSLFQVYGHPGQPLPFDPLYDLPDLGEMTLALLLLVLVAQSYLATGYLARLDGLRREGERVPFTDLAGRAFSRVLAYHAVTGFLLLVAGPYLAGEHGSGAAPLFVLGAVLFVLYFLFLTPFAVVVDDLPFAVALRVSVELATQEARQIVPFGLVYAVGTALLSVALLPLYALGAPGLLLAVPVVATVGTGLTASTLCLYAVLRPAELLPAPVPQPVPAEEAASA